jgi:hypothetical protein
MQRAYSVHDNDGVLVAHDESALLCACTVVRCNRAHTRGWSAWLASEQSYACCLHVPKHHHYA